MGFETFTHARRNGHVELGKDWDPAAGSGLPVLIEEGPEGPAREGRGAALGVMRSMGGAKPVLEALGRG